MGNKGKVTIFLCLIISSLVLIGLTIINIVNMYSAREKAVMCSRTAVSCARAQYSSYVFEHYHILLLDSNQANVEEEISGNLKENLGDNYKVNKVAITQYKTISENECEAFKEQVNEYMLYAAVEGVGNHILEAADGENYVPEEIISDMESGEVEEQDEESKEEVDDPRDFTKQMDKLGLLTFALPMEEEVSSEKVDISKLPSFSKDEYLKDAFKVNADFDDYDQLKADLGSHGGWAEAVTNMGTGITYAKTVFNSFVDNEKNQDTVLRCEMEYLICGKASDYDNLEGVVAKISAMRLPVNYAHLAKNPAKKSQIMTISVPLSIALLTPEPIVRSLIAGGWAYVESVAEVRNLLEGKCLPYKKNSHNWITDLSNLGDSLYGEMPEDTEGLSYEDYLCILLAMKQDKLYPRMLDVIQLNAQAAGEEFDIAKAGVEFSVDIQLEHDGRNMGFNIKSGF